MNARASHPARRAFALAFAAALAIAGGPFAHAQAWPERTVRLVSVSGPGSGVDDFMRLAARYFSQRTGQSFVIENRPGANSIIATEIVAKSAPDGYTFLVTAASGITANPFMFKRLPYDTNKDLAPVARLSFVPAVLLVPATSPYRDWADLVAGARARPGKLSFGTSTTGYRVMTVALNSTARMDALDVPYKGSANLVTDLIAGTLDYALLEVSQAVPLVRSGKVRPLAVISPVRLPILPDVPTLPEVGVSEAMLSSWMGIFAPAGTPQPMVDRLARLSAEFVETAEAKAHFAQRGTTPYFAATSNFRAAIAEDQERWKKSIEAAGIQPE